MERREFRFKRELFCINGVYNVPGFIICTGHGYDFQTYCCKNCGEIYVEELEGSYFQKTDFDQICKDKTCQKCKSNLETSLVRYPENIFHNGKLMKNADPIIKSPCDETDNLLEVYVLN